MIKYSMIILLLMAGTTVYGRTIDSLFVKAPMDVLPVLTVDARQDILDFYDANQKADVKNGLGEPCRLDTITDTYLRIVHSTALTIEMKVVYAKGTPYLLLNETTCSQHCDSHLRLFDMQWEPATCAALTAIPAASEFVSKRSNLKNEEVKSLLTALSPAFVKASLRIDEEVVDFELQEGLLLEAKDRETLGRYFETHIERKIEVAVKKR